AEGFNVGKMAEDHRNRVQVGNSVYTLISVAMIVTPVKSGSFEVGPVGTKLVIELPRTDRRRDPYDPFGMFNRNEQKEITLATEPQTLKVLPLPSGAPPSFKGAVGHYTMTATAGPTNVAVGDPITLRIRIVGQGNLDAVALPDQIGWDDFKTYPPTSKVETTDPLGIDGVKTFEQVVTPQKSDLKTLPPFSFSYFDPDQKRYQTLTQPETALTVRPGGSTPIPSVAAARAGKDNTPPASQDIVPIKQRIGSMARLSAPLVGQAWFLAGQSVPLIALIGAIAWRKRKESLANNPRLRRQRQVAQIVRDGLNELRRSAASNDSDQFFATVFRLLQEQLGERLDLPASAITEAVIEERLRPKGVSDSILSGLHELFQLSNLARYAPIRSSQELTALIPKVETVLLDLREVSV
ncbi:MAG: BatD family protein, partial [Verrucomicrobiota bacterium]